ncbi:MAG: pseudouridine synthase [Enterobacterales bacterium]|nr:pseudouridine synthase [Enterobacterales bacterium]
MNRKLKNSQRSTAFKRRNKPSRLSPLKMQNAQLVLFNKPFNTLCQFSGQPQDDTLANYIPIKSIYPAGRLDKDSEGLLLLTNDGQLQHKIAHPTQKMIKTYWVQLEGIITTDALKQLEKGVILKDGKTRPAKAALLDIEKQSLKIGPRKPPIRQRKNIPTCWISLSIKEGKNRQVRRMTASVGFPTLRLIRVSIGDWHLNQLQPGEYTQWPID